MLELRPHELGAIDHHCHGIITGPLDREAFEDLITESAWPAGRGTSHFDTPLGLAVLRWCPPVLDLDPWCAPDEYLRRRAELGAEASRRLLAAAGGSCFVLDTGYRSSDITDVAEFAALSGAETREVVRLESVAETVFRAGSPSTSFAAAFEDALVEAARSAVGLKSVLAYRHGFAIDPARPAAHEVAEAAGRWFARAESGEARLTDPVILRHILWVGAELARERRFPVQFHAGFGDPDVTLHLANPALLTDLVRDWAQLGVDVVYLHCYPYHREAAYLAAVYPNVYFDLGLTVNYTAPSARHVMAEAMELAPFTKQLYSSDAFGAAELYCLGSRRFWDSLNAVLEAWVGAGACTSEGAQRIARLIARENALRIYPLQDLVRPA